MTLPLTPAIGKPDLVRRDILVGVSAIVASALLVPQAMRAARPAIMTPPQMTGPFYPLKWIGDIDNDLVHVIGSAAQALGTVTHISGRVTDSAGAPMSGAMIEIWQCDANGRYRHPGDRNRSSRLDLNFQGRGRTICDADGRYTFRTIQPTAYPGRTPHIHFAIRTRDGRQLITQMYVEGEAANSQDSILKNIRDQRQRGSVLVSLISADRIETGALAGIFNIVLA